MQPGNFFIDRDGQWFTIGDPVQVGEYDHGKLIAAGRNSEGFAEFVVQLESGEVYRCKSADVTRDDWKDNNGNIPLYGKE